MSGLLGQLNIQLTLDQARFQQMWGSDNICIRKKKKIGGNWGKMVENWVLFCIKVGGELLGFKHF
ncbi:TPA: hypothetical protein ACPJNL_000037 [Haemophilus influenzae]|uniref:hypothetical protein n=1 Tax=Haemophilus influenzae TaxID=727 RepID=UPI0034DA0024|nr:hypothetical protein [Haemophilus influenzae]MCK8910042.1 hypothetical protein [Haemophilus influenzae]